MGNFHIGQDIVAINNHSQGAFREGDIFQIKNIKQGCCYKTPLMIDTGIKHIYYATFCNECEKSHDGSIWWFSSNSFRPLDELVTIEEIKELLNEPIYY